MRKPLSPAMLKVLEEPLMDRIPDCTGGIPRGGSLSGDVLVRALPGEVVLNRSDRLIVVEKRWPHPVGMNPGERVTMKGGVIRSRQLMQDPEPKESTPHPDDGLPDPGNGRPCPPDTRGGCPDEPPRPVPDPSPPRPGEGPVIV